MIKIILISFLICLTFSKKCEKNQILEPFNHTCLEKIKHCKNTLIGYSFEDKKGVLLCLQCEKGFEDNNGKCIKHRSKFLEMLFSSKLGKNNCNCQNNTTFNNKTNITTFTKNCHCANNTYGYDLLVEFNDSPNEKVLKSSNHTWIKKGKNCTLIVDLDEVLQENISNFTKFSDYCIYPNSTFTFKSAVMNSTNYKICECFEKNSCNCSNHVIFESISQNDKGTNHSIVGKLNSVEGSTFKNNETVKNFTIRENSTSYSYEKFKNKSSIAQNSFYLKSENFSSDSNLSFIRVEKVNNNAGSIINASQHYNNSYLYSNITADENFQRNNESLGYGHYEKKFYGAAILKRDNNTKYDYLEKIGDVNESYDFNNSINPNSTIIGSSETINRARIVNSTDNLIIKNINDSKKRNITYINNTDNTFISHYAVNNTNDDFIEKNNFTRKSFHNVSYKGDVEKTNLNETSFKTTYQSVLNDEFDSFDDSYGGIVRIHNRKYKKTNDAEIPAEKSFYLSDVLIRNSDNKTFTSKNKSTENSSDYLSRTYFNNLTGNANFSINIDKKDRNYYNEKW